MMTSGLAKTNVAGGILLCRRFISANCNAMTDMSAVEFERCPLNPQENNAKTKYMSKGYLQNAAVLCVRPDPKHSILARPHSILLAQSISRIRRKSPFMSLYRSFLLSLSSSLYVDELSSVSQAATSSHAYLSLGRDRSDLAVISIAGDSEYYVNPVSILAYSKYLHVSPEIKNGQITAKIAGHGELALSSTGAAVKIHLKLGEEKILDPKFLMAWNTKLHIEKRFSQMPSSQEMEKFPLIRQRVSGNLLYRSMFYLSETIEHYAKVLMIKLQTKVQNMLSSAINSVKQRVIDEEYVYVLRGEGDAYLSTSLFRDTLKIPALLRQPVVKEEATLTSEKNIELKELQAPSTSPALKSVQIDSQRDQPKTPVKYAVEMKTELRQETDRKFEESPPLNRQWWQFWKSK